MAKKITISGSNLLSSLSDAWGGSNSGSSPITVHGTGIPAGAEWGMNRGEVERFIKAQLAILGTKIGCPYIPNAKQGDGFYHLWGFADSSSRDLYLSDSTTYASLLLCDISIPISMELTFVHKGRGKSRIDESSGFWNSGFISVTGTINSSSAYSYSEPIKLNKGETIELHTAGYNITVIALTDSSASSYSPIIAPTSGDSSTVNTYTYTASADCYVAVVAKTTLEYSVYQTFVDIKLSEIEDNVTESSVNILPSGSKSVTVFGTDITYNNGVITITGTASSTGGRTTNILPVYNLVLPAGSYYFLLETSDNISGYGTLYLQKKSNNDIISYLSDSERSATFTLSEETLCYIGYYVKAEKVYNCTLKVLLKYGNTPSEWYATNYITAIDRYARKKTNEGVPDGSIGIDKLGITTVEYGSNRLNKEDPDYIHQQGYYIRYDNGTEQYTSSTSTPIWGRTGYIEVSKDGLYCNAANYSGYSGYAVYNSSKQYIRGAQQRVYTYVEGDAYVRFTLKENPESPYTDGQFAVFEGTTPLDYVPYNARKVIDNEYLPQQMSTPVNGENIIDETIPLSKLNNGSKISLSGYGVDVVIPNKIYVVLGDTIRIFWRSIIKAPNPYIYDITAVSSVGKNYPRYYIYTADSLGDKSVTINVKNANGDVIVTKTFTISVINHIGSPSANKNILTIGASATATGYIAWELNRRLTGNDGDGTPANPTGLGLSNFTFVGRTTGSVKRTIHQEATGGWSWLDYSTQGRPACRFQVTNVNGLSIGATYRDSNSNYIFEILEINVTEGTGNIRCSYGSGTVSIAASGALTKVSGNGDSTIQYTSYSSETYNPFWNLTDEELDFTTYANTYCNGSIDVIISHCGLNDIASFTLSTLTGLFENRIKPFVRAFHTEFPNAKFVFSTLPLGSCEGGMGANYGASSFWNYYRLALQLWKLQELAHTMEADSEFSSYFMVADVVPFFDCENLYPTTNTTVTNRSTNTEVVGTNGVHPIEVGSYTVADSIYARFNTLTL